MHKASTAARSDLKLLSTATTLAGLWPEGSTRKAVGRDDIHSQPFLGHSGRYLAAESLGSSTFFQCPQDDIRGWFEHFVFRFHGPQSYSIPKSPLKSKCIYTYIHIEPPNPNPALIWLHAHAAWVAYTTVARTNPRAGSVVLVRTAVRPPQRKTPVSRVATSR